MKAETLKKSILQYAMEGKLVPQDPNDEPASELLNRIKAEKEQLIKEGKIKKDKTESYIFKGEDNKYYEQIGSKTIDITDEIPFEIPQGWEWCRLGNIFQHNTGKALNSSNNNGITKEYITTSNLYWNEFKLDNLREMYFSSDEIKKYTVQKGDLLVCEGGDVGRAAIWEYDYGVCIQNHIHKLTAYDTLCIKFFYYLFYLYKNTGLIGGKGIGIKGLSSNALHILLFPIPPLPEQQRIVDKLEQILPLIDEYKINEEKLAKLNETLPAKIKQSILQHAVQGKLVEQDPNDEPASELLKRIKAEKEQLIKEGKIKKDKTESYIYKGEDNNYYEQIGSKTIDITDEIPFEIPQGWEWVRLKNICSKIVDGDHNPPSGCLQKTKYLMLSASNINYDKITELDKVRYLTKEIFELENKRTNLKTGDILFTIVGTLGRSCIYTGSQHLCFQRSVAVLTTFIFNAYLKIVLDSPFIQKYMVKNATGTAQKGFYLNQVAELIIPVPPYSEQQKITNKVYDFQSIINDL